MSALEDLAELRALDSHRVLIVGRARLSSLLERLPNARVVEPDRHFWRQLREQRRSGFDAVIVAEGSLDSAIFALAIPANAHFICDERGRLKPLGPRTFAAEQWSLLNIAALRARRKLAGFLFASALSTPRGPGNDYTFIEERLSTAGGEIRTRVIADRPTAATLHALEQQTHPRSAFDVVAVDSELGAEARRRAIAASDAELIVLLDERCVPSPNFIAGHARWFQAHSGALVTIGAVAGEAPPNAKQHRAPHELATRGNLAFRKKDAELIDTWGTNVELAFHLYRRGAYVVLDPAASVFLERSEPVAFFPTPSVSVYVPAYNSARFIRRAVESALKQTHRELEVCIADDGSTDDTPSILRALAADPRVRFMRQEHGGISSASRAAIALTRGEFILQLDADDELLPHAVEALLAQISSAPDISLAYGGYQRIDEHGRLEGVFYPRPYDAFEHLHIQLIQHPRMFRARDYYRTAGFDLSLESCVDFDIYLKIAEQGRVVAVPQILYRYQVHGENISVVRAKQQRQNHAHVVRAALARRGLDWGVETPLARDPKRIRLVFPGGIWRRAASRLRGR